MQLLSRIEALESTAELTASYIDQLNADITQVNLSQGILGVNMSVAIKQLRWELAALTNTTINTGELHAMLLRSLLSVSESVFQEIAVLKTEQQQHARVMAQVDLLVQLTLVLITAVVLACLVVFWTRT